MSKMKRKEVKSFINNLTQIQQEDILDVYLNGINAKCYKEERTILPKEGSCDYLSNKDVEDDMSHLYDVLDSPEFFPLIKKTVLKSHKNHLHSNFNKLEQKTKLLSKKQLYSFLSEMSVFIIPSIIGSISFFVFKSDLSAFFIIASFAILLQILKKVEIVSFDEFTYFDDLQKISQMSPKSKFNSKPTKAKTSNKQKFAKGLKPKKAAIPHVKEILKEIEDEENIELTKEEYIQFCDVFIQESSSKKNQYT